MARNFIDTAALYLTMATMFFIVLLVVVATAFSKVHDPVKAKFYDFGNQIIDGEIRKPTHLYTDARTRVKFTRLLKLKKTFIPRIFDNAKERLFK